MIAISLLTRSLVLFLAQSMHSKRMEPCKDMDSQSDPENILTDFLKYICYGYLEARLLKRTLGKKVSLPRYGFEPQSRRRNMTLINIILASRRLGNQTALPELEV